MMRGLISMLVACTVSGAASNTLAQTATVELSGPMYFAGGDVIEIVVSLDAGGLPADALGLAGWNIAVDIDPRIGQIVQARYTTPTSPLIDQNNPFGGDPTPVISADRLTVNFSEGLNALAPVSAFHTGGALAVLTVDTTGGNALEFDPWATSRKGDSPLGAFTYATPATSPFSYVGTDFENAQYGILECCIPAPGTCAVLIAAGALAARRRRG